MKIRTSLLILSATFIMLIVAIGLITFRAFGLINTEIEKGSNVSRLIKDVLELDVVTYEWLTYHEKRMLEQWTLRYDSVGKLLERMTGPDLHPKCLPILRSVASDCEALGDLFSQLQSNLARRKRLVEENGSETEINLSLVLEERIMAQALMRSQKIASAALELSAVTEQAISQTQQRAGSLIVFSIMTLAVLSACISFITVRSITKPVEKLVRGTEIIGEGNLGHRVDVRARNEIGELATAFNEMTERRQRVDEELRRLNEELEQRILDRTTQLAAANKELAAFSYSVSHDLRAPLRGIDGFGQALLEDYGDKLDEEGKSYLDRVRAAAQRMAQLIDDMLQLSRLTRDEMNRELIDLSSLARGCVDRLRQEQPGRHIETVIQDGLKANADQRLLEAVLDNLLGNAWKFTGKTKDARIEFGVQIADCGLRIADPNTDSEDLGDEKDSKGIPKSEIPNPQSVYFVRDNGVGFDAAYADKLFGAFQRLHTQDEFPGTGIGLATVQRVIHRHGGRVWAEGEVGKGATFYFTLAQ